MDKLRWNRFKWKMRELRDKVVYYVTMPYVRLRNYVLVKKFPFLKPQCGWGVDMEYHKPGYKYRYEETWLDGMPKAWRRSFGIQLCINLKHIIERDGLTDYKVRQVKEKFGGLRWYDEGGNKYTAMLIESYEHLSMTMCFYCGRKAEYVGTEWIVFYCPKCAKKAMKRGRQCVPLKNGIGVIRTEL